MHSKKKKFSKKKKSFLPNLIFSSCNLNHTYNLFGLIYFSQTDKEGNFTSSNFTIRNNYFDGGMDGSMTCDFTSFLTVFQSYQDD